MNAPAPASPAWSPAADTQLTCWASAWIVAAPVRPGRYTLTARFCSGSTCMTTGSLRTCAPAGIRTDALPPKVTGWIVPGTTAAPRPASATVTWPTCSGDTPKALVSSSLIELPPTLVKTTSRTVWLAKPTAATVRGVAPCGLALQLVTQASPRRAATAGREGAKTAMAATRTSRTARPGSTRRTSRAAFLRPVQLAASMVSPHPDPASGEAPFPPSAHTGSYVIFRQLGSHYHQ